MLKRKNNVRQAIALHAFFAQRALSRRVSVFSASTLAQSAEAAPRIHALHVPGLQRYFLLLG